ncbi:mitochondrial import inner membrane translocase subunit Tim9-like [Halichondria panicea]|uniref:mitochondrial import inner membrane translocase subunit Tim9-like n=1 Tax=Halichondria panicea TaxID=6063 RepID=UPI00312BB702
MVVVLVMEALTPEQRSQLEVTQFKDFLTTYNNVTENCFTECVNDFTARRLSKHENECCMNCVDKYVKMSQRITMRLQEHLQMQQTNAPNGTS